MTVRLEVPVECRRAVREELDKLPIAYREHMLKSAGWPAVFELISTAIQDVGALVSTLGVIVQIVQNTRSTEANLTPQQSKWLIGMVNDENLQEAIIRLKDGRVLTLGSDSQQAAEEILRNTDRVDLTDAESGSTEE